LGDVVAIGTERDQIFQFDFSRLFPFAQRIQVVSLDNLIIVMKPARLTLFLASDAAPSLIGSRIAIDGGLNVQQVPRDNMV
jgi:hypothetical protein